MKRKYLITLIIFILCHSGLSSYAVDYYPELGLDPFYSSLNPEYVNKEETDIRETDTLLDVFKKKKQNKSDISKNKEEHGFWSIFNKKEKSYNQHEEDVLQDDNFITQPKKSLTRKELERELKDEERQREKESNNEIVNEENTFSLKEKFGFFKKKNKKEEAVVQKDPDMTLSADFMEYFPDRFEVEAVGNAKVEFKTQNTILTANKITFNYDKNILKANENVVIINSDSITEGDFVKIDLRKPNGWVENPITTMEDIKLSAKEAFLYSDKIEEYDGVAKILKDDVLSFGARSFASYVDQGRIFKTNTSKLSDDGKGVYKLKANTILIDSKDDHEVVTVKNADLYLKNFKLATVPSIKIVTNKEHASVETNLPEFGSQSMLGTHIGPAVVLNVPGGSTLKLAPILTYKDDKLGVGGIARFRNQYNMTEVAYGTSEDELVIRGRHKLAPGLLLNYSRYTNQNEWFLGYRMPKYSAQLSYSKSNYVKDLKLNFSQLYSAGVFVDRKRNVDFGDAEGRFRWMTQTSKPLFQYLNEEGNLGLRLGLVAQTSATVYTTGDTAGLVRFGPALSTKVGPWTQAVMYYITGSAGESPFSFDRYRYGRSNVVLIESLKVCKYLSLGYLASLSMNSDYKNDDLFQENRIVVSIGPEYAKFTVGYDSRRKNTMFVFSMLVGTKDSDIAFKKSVLKNPEKFGNKKDTKNKTKKKSYKKYLKEKNTESKDL